MYAQSDVVYAFFSPSASCLPMKYCTVLCYEPLRWKPSNHSHPFVLMDLCDKEGQGGGTEEMSAEATPTRHVNGSEC